MSIDYLHMDPHLTATENLLTACANPFSPIANVAAALQRDVDWKRFVDAAQQHRLLPLVHKHLSSLSDSRVPIPVDVIEKARKAYMASAVRMEFLIARKSEISTIFKTAGVRGVPWKGPDLAARAYTDSALRPADDLDYLVHPEDIPGAIEALSSPGFAPKLKMKDSTRARYLAAGYEYIMISAENDLYVELAARPVPPPSPLDGKPMAIWESENGDLTPERYFVYLCMHGARHCWDRLIWIADLCFFLDKHKEMSWECILQIAKDARAETMLLSAIDLMEYAGYSTPTLKLDVRRIPAEQLLHNAFHSDRISFLEEAKRRSAMHTGFIDRANFLARWLLAPTFSDWQAVSLPSGLGWLYWIIRPFRIALSRIRRRFSQP